MAGFRKGGRGAACSENARYGNRQYPARTLAHEAPFSADRRLSQAFARTADRCILHGGCSAVVNRRSVGAGRLAPDGWRRTVGRQGNRLSVRPGEPGDGGRSACPLSLRVDHRAVATRPGRKQTAQMALCRRFLLVSCWERGDAAIPPFLLEAKRRGNPPRGCVIGREITSLRSQ